MTEKCEPLNLRERIARAIHEGLGQNWAYSNYGGDEWNSCRYMLDDAADKVLAIVTPPATVAALVEALEAMASAANHENWHLDCVLAKVLSDATSALAAYREAAR